MLLFVIFCLKFLSLYLAAAENSIALKYPFLVRIYFKHATEEDSHCGGVIVDKDLVLTSAQCCTVVGDAYIVYGDTDHTDYVNGKNLDRYHEWGVAGKMLHDGYQELPDGAHVHDVCLMKLNRELPDDDGHRVIELPSERLSTVTDCIVPGWGSILNNTIQHVLEVETVFPKECQDGSSLCVKLEANCRGDGGNPIVCEDSAGRRIVYGVDSYYLYAAGSDMTCDDIETNYFVNLYKEKDFLDRHVRSAPHSAVVESGHGGGKNIGELAEIVPARGGVGMERSTAGLPRGGRETEKLNGKLTGITTDRGVEELEISTVTLPEGGQDKDRETGKWTDITTARGVDGLEITTVVLPGGGGETEKVGKSTGVTTDGNTGDQELNPVVLPGGGKDKEKEIGKWTEMTTVKNVDELGISTFTLPGGGRETEKGVGAWTEKTTARGIDQLEISTVTLPGYGKDKDRETGTWAESTTVRISDDRGLSTAIFPEDGRETEKVLGKWTGITMHGGVEELEVSTVTLPAGGQDKDKEKEIGKWAEMTTQKHASELEMSTVILPGAGQDEEIGKWTEITTKRGTDDLGLSTTEKLDDFTGQEQGRGTGGGSNKATEEFSETSSSFEIDQEENVGLLTTTNGEGKGMEQQLGGNTEKGQEQETHGEEVIKSTEPGEYRTTAGEQKISNDEVESGTSKESGGPTGKDWSETRLTTVETEEKATETVGNIYEKSTDEPFVEGTTHITERVLPEASTNDAGKETEGGSVEVSIKPEEGTVKEEINGEETAKTLFVTGQTTKSYVTEDEGFGGDSRGTVSHTGPTKMVHEVGTEKSFSGTVEPSVHGATGDYEQASTLDAGREFDEGTNAALLTTTRKGLLPGTEEVPDVKSTLIGSGPGPDRTTSKAEGAEKEKPPLPGSDVPGHGEYGTTLEMETEGTESVLSEYDEGSGHFSGDGSGNVPEGDSSRTTERSWDKSTAKQDEKGTETEDESDENLGGESGEEWKESTVRAKISGRPGLAPEQETTPSEKGTEDWRDTAGTERATGFESQDNVAAKKPKKKLPGVIHGGVPEESGVGDVEETETGSEHGLATEEELEDEYGSGEGSGVRPEEGPFEGTEMEVTRATVKGREKVTESTHQEPDEYIEQSHTKGPGGRPEYHLTATTRKEWKGSTFISQGGDTEIVTDEYDEDFDQSYSVGSGSTRKPFSRGSTGRKWRTTTARVKWEGTEKISDEYDADIDHLYTEAPGSIQSIHSTGTTRKKWRITTTRVKGEGTQKIPVEYDEDFDQSFTEGGSDSTGNVHSRTTRKKWRITTAEVKEGTESIPKEYDEDVEPSYTEGLGSTLKFPSRATTRKKWRITTTRVKGEGTQKIPVEYDEDFDQSFTEGGSDSTGNVHSRTTRKKWRITTAKVKEGTESIPKEYDEDIDQSYTEGSGSTKNIHSRRTTRKKWKASTLISQEDDTKDVPDEYDEDFEQSYTEDFGTTQKLHFGGTTKKKLRITTAKVDREEEEDVPDEYDVNIEGTPGKSKQTTPGGKSPKKLTRPPVQQKTTRRSHGKEHGPATEEGWRETETEAGSGMISGEEYGSGGSEGDSGGGGESWQAEFEGGTKGITAKTWEHGFQGSGIKTKGKQTRAPSGFGTPFGIPMKPKFYKANSSTSGNVFTSKAHPKGHASTPESKSAMPLTGSTHSPGRNTSRVTFAAGAADGGGGGGGGGGNRGPPRSPSAKARAMIRYEQYYDDESPLTHYSGALQFSPNFFIIFFTCIPFFIA